MRNLIFAMNWVIETIAYVHSMVSEGICSDDSVSYVCSSVIRILTPVIGVLTLAAIVSAVV